MNTPTKIIINADDFGFSPRVNSAILRCAERGTITAASVMVNMPYAEEAFAQVQKRVPHLSLALHFTLTSGKPICPPEDVPMLVNAHGFFHLGFPNLLRYLASNARQALLAQIAAELSAQLLLMEQLARKYQCRFDHLDSHQHVHAISDIWELLHRESTLRCLPLRVPREHWGNFKRCYQRGWTWFPQGLLKQAILNRCLRNISQEIGYFGILETGRMDTSALSAIFQSVGQRAVWETYEINTHPSALSEADNEMTCCSEADKQFHASSWREREFQVLNDDDVIRWAQQYNITFAGFRTLATVR